MEKDNRQIKIKISGQSCGNIYYSFNKESKFQYLLEHLAFLFPSLNICECYEFYIDNQYSPYNKIKIKKESLLSDYSGYLNTNNNLYLDKKKKSCSHSKDSYLNFSKEEIFSSFQENNEKLIEENKSLNEQIKNKNKTIKDLRTEISKSDNNNYFLKREIEIKNKTIKDLNNQLKKLKDNNSFLNKEIKNKENIILNLEFQLKSLKKNIFLLEKYINGEIVTIQKLKELGYGGDNLKEKENLIKIDPKTNQIISNQEDKNKKYDFYDVIVHIDSIKDINKGWKIEMTQNGEQNYQNFKKLKTLKIGVIGNANKGKSFLLSKISKMEDIPSGMFIKTEGLSIKYPDLEEHKDRKIVLLDSAGLETPVLASEGENIDAKDNDFFKEKSREKIITELFLQNYIIYNSDILIVVVDMLSFSEQKLLLKVKKIKKDMEKSNTPLYIIHNLKSLNTVEQVKDYIQNTLLKNATFTLEKGHNVSTDINQNDGIYYYEVTKDKSQQIYHLIYANESSLEVRHFNDFTLNFIEHSYQSVTHLEPFDIIESIKDRYINLSKDIIEKTEMSDNSKLTKESFDDSDPSLIKLKSENEIVLKKCLIDELGFSNLKANGFEPTYNIYKKDDKLIIRLETPGNCDDIKSKIDRIDKYNVIKITGEKKKDKEPEKLEDNIYNKREIGKFLLEIPLKNEEYRLINKKPEFIKKKGITILEYSLDEKPNEAVFGNEEEEL